MDVYGFKDKATAEALKRKVASGQGDEFTQGSQPMGSRRGSAQFFITLEDWQDTGNGPVRAKRVTRTGTESLGEFDLYDFGTVMQNAPADTRVIAENIAGEWVVTAADCIAPLSSAAFISNSSYLSGTGGAAFSHTVTTTGLDGPATADAATLPAGITASNSGNDVVLSGTPTVEGEFDIRITGTATENTIVIPRTRITTVNITGSSAVPVLCLGFNEDAFVGNPPGETDLTPYNKGGVATSWTATNLPPGISLSNAGILSGSYTTVGDYNVTIEAANANGSSFDVFNVTVSNLGSV